MSDFTIEVSKDVFKEIDLGTMQSLTIPASRSATKTFSDNPPQQFKITVAGEPTCPPIVFPFNGYLSLKRAGRDFFALPLKKRQYNLF